MSDVGAAPTTGKTLKEAALADAGGLTLRYPEAFLPNWRQRCVTIASVSVLTGLLWALIWINVVGLGPFAGILAIATSDFGSLGKVFSKAIETADNKAVEGILSAGGGPFHAVRFGIVPQVMPVFISQILYFLESNTRSSTIIGIVGAGGIGQHFSEQIIVVEWQHVAFLILLVLVTVAVIDYLSRWLRAAIIGKASTM